MKNIELKSSFYLIPVICFWDCLIEHFSSYNNMKNNKMCEHVSQFQTKTWFSSCDQFQSISFPIRKLSGMKFVSLSSMHDCEYRSNLQFKSMVEDLFTLTKTCSSFSTYAFHPFKLISIWLLLHIVLCKKIYLPIYFKD